MPKLATPHHSMDTVRQSHRVHSQEVLEDQSVLLMSFKKRLIELTAESLIACRECRAIADVSMNGSLVKLICPRCYETLGSWATTSEAAADMTAFVAHLRARR